MNASTRSTPHGGVLALALMATASMAGCENVESEDVGTAGMAIDARFTDEGEGVVQGDVQLLVGGTSSTTYVSLSAGDTLTLSADGMRNEMQRSEALDAVWYSARLSNVQPGARVTVDLERTDDSDGRVSAVMPPAFSITAPAAGAMSSRGEDLEVRWDANASGTTVDVDVSGSCIDFYDADGIPDTGALTIPAGVLVDEDANPDATCDVRVKVRRLSSGTVHEGFDEGAVVLGIQERVVEIQSTR